MTDDPGSLESAAAALQATVGRLEESVRNANDVRDQLSDLVKRSRFNRKLAIVTSCGAVISLVIIIALVAVVVQLRTVVQVQRDSALCPLYKIFIESDTPQNRERARLQGQDTEERDRAFSVIRHSYEALECEG